MSAERPRRISRTRNAPITGCRRFRSLGIAPLLGACGQGTPDEAGSVATAVPAEAPASTPAFSRTRSRYGTTMAAISQTVEAFKRANPTIGVDLQGIRRCGARAAALIGEWRRAAGCKHLLQRLCWGA